mgnify:CR=1 FL=1
MPEGPELLFVAVYLRKMLKNADFVNILSFTDKPVKVPKNLTGKITNIDSKGKLLWFNV